MPDRPTVRPGRDTLRDRLAVTLPKAFEKRAEFVERLKGSAKRFKKAFEKRAELVERLKGSVKCLN